MNPSAAAVWSSEASSLSSSHISTEEACAFSLKEVEALGTVAAARLEHERERQALAWAAFPKDLLAGAAVGGIAHTAVAPIERAKLMLQTQESNSVILEGKQPRYKGLLDCLVRVSRDEGVLSLWRGNGTSVMRYYPSLGLNFAFKDFYRNMLTAGKEYEAGSLARAPSNFLAGAGAGCSALLMVYPLDIAHTRLATDLGKGKARQFRGMAHFLETVYRKDGVRGVYRGFPASFQGMLVHRSIYFGGFDTAKDYMATRESQHLPFWKTWILAQGATCTAGLVSYPLDTVRHRMMMQAGLGQSKFSSTLDCWKKIYRLEGVSSFYSGLPSKMVRSTGAAVVLALYDEMKYLMHWRSS